MLDDGAEGTLTNKSFFHNILHEMDTLNVVPQPGPIPAPRIGRPLLVTQSRC